MFRFRIYNRHHLAEGVVHTLCPSFHIPIIVIDLYDNNIEYKIEPYIYILHDSIYLYTFYIKTADARGVTTPKTLPCRLRYATMHSRHSPGEY